MHAGSGFKPLRCLLARPVSHEEDAIFFHEGVKILQELVANCTFVLSEVEEVLPPRLLACTLLSALEKCTEDVVETSDEVPPVFNSHIASSTLQVLEDALSL